MYPYLVEFLHLSFFSQCIFLFFIRRKKVLFFRSINYCRRLALTHLDNHKKNGKTLLKNHRSINKFIGWLANSTKCIKTFFISFLYSSTVLPNHWRKKTVLYQITGKIFFKNVLNILFLLNGSFLYCDWRRR